MIARRFTVKIGGFWWYGWWMLTAAVLAGSWLGGCERPSLPPDPGQIVFGIPKVEGTEKPYPLEPLGPPSQEALEQLRLP
ncbi:MAG: hypothetical protein NZ602_16635 [Thermoguttaceae bacterium]|nr:hypothetical protein [Thermoguttaceae bacterium]MDW8038524.1 hypothetical protein [Thermoguttaceae bacterium]